MADNNDKNKKSILEQYFSQSELDAMDQKMKKSLERRIKELGVLEQYSKKTKSAFDSIAKSFGNIESSDFYSKIKIADQDIARLTVEISKQEEVLKDVAATLKNQFQTSIAGVERQLFALSKTSTDISNDMATGLQQAIKTGSFSQLVQDHGIENVQAAINKLVKDKQGFDALKQFVTSDAVKGFTKMTDEVKTLQSQIDLNGKTVLDWGKGIDKILSNLTKGFRPDNIKANLFDFDKIIHETQRNSGIMVADTIAHEQAFTNLNTRAATFGLSIQDSANLMMGLSRGLHSTNFDVLSDAANDLAAMSTATGLSIDEVGELSSQMMFFGKTAKDVSKYSEDVMKSSYKYGVSGKKILQDINKSLPNIRALGWQGGADALQAMAMQAERLGLSVETLVDSSKKLRTLESSLETSADLALMGLNINPLQLLGAARKGGQDYLNMINQLGAGIGKFNKVTGEMEFNPLDYDILSQRAEAVGISVQDLQKQITKSAQDNQKVRLLPPGLFKGLKPEEQAFLLDSMKMKDGKLVNFKIGDLTNVSQLSATAVKAAAETTAKNKETLELQAQNNMHFQQSVDGLKGSIMSIFTFLQPIIDKLTGMVQGFAQSFSKWPFVLKAVFAGGVGLIAAVYSAGKQILAGYYFGIGFNKAAAGGGGFLGGIKALFKKNPGLPGGGFTQTGGQQFTGDTQQAEKVSKLSQALKAMPSPQQLLALSVALVALGLAFVGIGEGIKLAAEGLATLTQSFNNISNAGEALGAVSVVMGSFVGMLAIMIPLVGALSAAGTVGAIGLLALGASFTMIGFGIKLAADGLANLVQSFNNITNAGAALGAVAITMFSFIGALALMIPLVGVLGAAGTAGAIGLLALGASFTMIGFGIKLAADGLAALVGALNNAGANIIPFARAITQAAIPAVMFTGAIYAMVPAITALSLVGSLGALGISALGGAFMMLGLGSTLATNGLSKLSGVFAETNSKLIPFVETVSKAAVPMLMFSGGLYAMIPALVALGGTGILTSVGIMAVGAAIGYLGSGLKKSGEGLSLISKSFGDLSGVLSSLSQIGWGTLDTLSSSLEKLTPSFNNIKTSISESVSSLMGGMQNVIPQLQQVQNALSEQLGLISNGFNNILPGLDKAQSGISNKISAIINSFNSIVPTLESFKNNINESIGAVFNFLKGIGSVEGISAKFNNQIGAISNSINSILPTFLSIQNIEQSFSQAMTNISFAFEKLSPILQDAGRDFSQAMTNISSAFEKLSPGLEVIKSISKAFGDLSVGALITVSKAIDTVAIGFSKLSTVSWEALQNFGQNVTQIIPAIKKFAGLSDSTTAITSTAVALGMLAGALHIAGRGLMSIQNINWNTLGSIEAPLKSFIHGIGQIGNIDVTVSGLNQLGAIGPMIYVGASAIMALGAAIGQVQWDKFSLMGTSLDNAIPSLSAFGKTGFFAAPGIMIMNSVLGSLANTMNNLSPALDKASVSMLGLSQGVERLKIASSGLDTSNLNNLTEISNKLLNVPIAAPVAAPPTQTRSNSPQLTPIKIIVDHRTNGRDTYQEIVEAHTYSS